MNINPFETNFFFGCVIILIVVCLSVKNEIWFRMFWICLIYFIVFNTYLIYHFEIYCSVTDFSKLSNNSFCDIFNCKKELDLKYFWIQFDISCLVYNIF